MSAKIVTYDELKANSTKDSLWVLLHEKGMWFQPANDNAPVCLLPET